MSVTSRPDDVRSAVDLAFGPNPDPQKLLLLCVSLQGDVQSERRLAESWRMLAGRYDDIRYTLRNCDDTPEGHAEFYREAAALIFNYYEEREGDSQLMIGEQGDESG